MAEFYARNSTSMLATSEEYEVIYLQRIYVVGNR